MDGGQKLQSRNALGAEAHGGEQGARWGQAVCRALGLRERQTLLTWFLLHSGSSIPSWDWLPGRTSANQVLQK